MNFHLGFCLSCLLSLQTLTVAYAAEELNASDALPSKIDELPPSSYFLKDVLKAISARQRWNSDDVRVSDLDIRNVRVGGSQRYEFLVQYEKSDLVFRSPDEVPPWRKLGERGDFRSLVYQVSSKTVLDTFELEGPFELRVGGDDELWLVLPMNTTHKGLKRILVGEGIILEVKGAQEVSLFHTSDLGSPVNRSRVMNNDRNQFWPFRNSICMPLIPVHISGSASVVAYKSRNPDTHIETTFISLDTIELLPEKCYGRNPYKKQRFPIGFLSPRIAVLEKLLTGILGNRINRNGFSGFIKTKITALTLVRFQLELERNVGKNDTLWGTLAEWRTKPTVERAWFEVVARLEAERLKPIVVKKMDPFVGADTTSWSNLMSNISFTKFPSFLVPPEALTLDVKW